MVERVARTDCLPGSSGGLAFDCDLVMRAVSEERLESEIPRRRGDGIFIQSSEVHTIITIFIIVVGDINHLEFIIARVVKDAVTVVAVVRYM